MTIWSSFQQNINGDHNKHPWAKPGYDPLAHSFSLFEPCCCLAVLHQIFVFHCWNIHIFVSSGEEQYLALIACLTLGRGSLFLWLAKWWVFFYVHFPHLHPYWNNILPHCLVIFPLYWVYTDLTYCNLTFLISYLT